MFVSPQTWASHSRSESAFCNSPVNLFQTLQRTMMPTSRRSPRTSCRTEPTSAPTPWRGRSEGPALQSCCFTASAPRCSSSMTASLWFRRRAVSDLGKSLGSRESHQSDLKVCHFFCHNIEQFGNRADFSDTGQLWVTWCLYKNDWAPLFCCTYQIKHVIWALSNPV